VAWIKYEDMQPPDNEPFLAYDGESIREGLFRTDSEYLLWPKYDYEPWFGMTHWLPIPKPPKIE
jgi:hypothetical protein